MNGVKLQLRRGGGRRTGNARPRRDARQSAAPAVAASRHARRLRRWPRQWKCRLAPAPSPRHCSASSIARPSPASRPSWKWAAASSPDTIIGIIEVMKLMNTRARRRARRGRGAFRRAMASWSSTAKRCCSCARTDDACHADPSRADREPRRDRRARDPHLPGARASRRCWPCPKPDRDALPAQLADRAVCIGPGRPADSYLQIDTLVQAALSARMRCHPSGLRLSLRARGLRAALRGGRPRSSSARLPRRSRRSATSCAPVPRPRPRTCRWCPAVRCTRSRRRSALAARIGAPLLIKAVGGGGGRGMKRVDDLADLPAALDMASGRGRRGLRRCARLPRTLCDARPPCRGAGAG